MLTLFKPKYTFKTLVNPLKFQIIFIMLHFIFSSPELKAQVSFSDHLSSVVCLSVCLSVCPSVRL